MLDEKAADVGLGDDFRDLDARAGDDIVPHPLAQRDAVAGPPAPEHHSRHACTRGAPLTGHQRGVYLLTLCCRWHAWWREEAAKGGGVGRTEK